MKKTGDKVFRSQSIPSSSGSSSSDPHLGNLRPSWLKTLRRFGKKKKGPGCSEELATDVQYLHNPPEMFMTGVRPDWIDPDFPTPGPSTVPSPAILPIGLNVQCRLIVITRKPIKSADQLLSALEIWVDHYDGSLFLYPYYTLIYILLGAKLSQRKSTSSLLEHSAEYSGIVSLGYRPEQGKLPEGSFQIRMVEGAGSRYTAIKFEIRMMVSKRSGTIYPELYKKGGFNYPFTQAADLLKLPLAITSDGLLSPP